MSIRVWDSPVMHRFGHSEDDRRVAVTKCGVRFCRFGWPRGAAKPPLPRCSDCWA